MLQAARKAKPSDPAVYHARWPPTTTGKGNSTRPSRHSRSARRKSRTIPEAFYTISVYYWDKAYRDFKLTENEKKAFVDKGERGRRQGAQAQAGLRGSASSTRACCFASRRTLGKRSRQAASAASRRPNKLRDKAADIAQAEGGAAPTQ